MIFLSLFFIHYYYFNLFQAKYLAQIIVMGAQVVGRAFARALQQEYAGMKHLYIVFLFLLTY